MKFHIAIGISFLAIILLSEYHSVFSADIEYTVEMVIGAVVFGCYGLLASLVLLVTILIDKIPNYKNYIVHIVAALFLGAASSYLTSGGGYALAYVLLGVHAVLSIVFLICCLIFIPRSRKSLKNA